MTKLTHKNDDKTISSVNTVDAERERERGRCGIWKRSKMLLRATESKTLITGRSPGHFVVIFFGYLCATVVDSKELTLWKVVYRIEDIYCSLLSRVTQLQKPTSLKTRANKWAGCTMCVVHGVYQQAFPCGYKFSDHCPWTRSKPNRTMQSESAMTSTNTESDDFAI